MSRATNPIVLQGARITVDGQHTEAQDIVTHENVISLSSDPAVKSRHIDLSGSLLLPGLINAHDHLEFNLFPRLGSGPYANYIEWARDIYHPQQSPIKQHLAIPKPLRLLWGGLKNLLSGVTTVAHHNDYDRAVFDKAFPVNVVRKYGWAHSLEFTSDLRARFDQTPGNLPFIVHAAEGTDAVAHAEMAQLEQLGVLSDRTVLVHGIALRDADIEVLLRRKCALIWCPSSNIFTCGKTLSQRVLNSGIPIALGTDSALTAAGDMGDEICAARRSHPQISDRLLNMVTTLPAKILRLPPHTGTICDGSPAHLVAVRDRGQTPEDSLAHLFPELVIVSGKIRVISRRLLEQNPGLNSGRWQRICVHGRGEAFVPFKLDRLYEQTIHYLGPKFQLAGREVTL